MSATIDILESFFNSWTLKRPIDSIVATGADTAKMVVCDPLWLSPCVGFYLDGVPFEATQVNLVAGKYEVHFSFTAPIPTATEYQTQEVYFRHGQPIRLNYEETRNVNLSKFLKMYLFDLFDEELNIGTDSIVDHTDRIKLFALLPFELAKSDIDKITFEVYRPMRILLREVVNALHKRYGFNKVNRARLINHPDFGVYLNSEDRNNINSAFGKNLFDQTLGGVELEMSIEVLLSDCNCKT